MTAYVGIDLHRRRSLAVCIDDEGDRLWWRRFERGGLRGLVAFAALAAPKATYLGFV